MSTPNLLSLTTVTPSVLASSQLASGANTVYTVPSSKAVKVEKMVLTNVHATLSRTVTVTLLPSGGSVDGTHEVVHAFVLEAGDTLIVDEMEGVWLGEADSIRANASAATSIDVAVSGLVFT